MDHAAPGPARYDGDVSGSFKAVEGEFVSQVRGQRGFEVPRAGHAGCEGTAGLTAYAAEEGEFGGGFYGAERVEEGCEW